MTQRDLGKPSSKDVRDLSHEILEFLLENPRARDTLEGITEWWLLERDIQRETERVRQALSRLVADDLIDEVQGADGRRHYLLNRRRLEAIRERVLEWRR